MPPKPSTRITPPQILALVIIWGAVAYGLTANEGPGQVVQAETVQLAACR